MIINDCVLDERRYTGATPPPASFEDVSRSKIASVAHTAITWVRLPSGLWVRSFNGATSLVSRVVANWCDYCYSGTIIAWVKPTNLDGTMSVFASCDTASGNYYLNCSIQLTTGRLGINQRDNDVPDAIESTESLTAGVWSMVGYVSTGTAYGLYLNGVALTVNVTSGGDNGDWLSDTSNRDNWTYGVLRRNNDANWFLGQMAPRNIYNYQLTADQIYAKYQNERGWFAR